MGQHNWNASLSYVTGAHSMKFGYQGTFYADDEQYFTNDEKVQYRFNNGVPNLVTLTLHSNLRKLRTRYHAFYAQEQWTIGRMTLQGAVRLRPRVELLPGAGRSDRRGSCPPDRVPETEGVKGYNDISPRLGLAYDVFGNGRTSLKFNFGKYLDAASNNNGNYSITNPTVAHGRQHRGRAAADHADLERQLLSDGDRDQELRPDCDLLIPDPQRRVGAPSATATSARPRSATTSTRRSSKGGACVRPTGKSECRSSRRSCRASRSRSATSAAGWTTSSVIDNLATVPAGLHGVLC